jgi:tripartite-type tricarboxylate transporter receptor subunit TctC
MSLTTRRSPGGEGGLIAGTTVSEPVTSIESRKAFMNFKSLLSKFVYVAVITITTNAASAQNYPDHPIRVIIPYAPGGGTDIAFRIIAPKAGTILNATIIVDNRPGASTMIGTGTVSRATPDGYTLLASDSAFVINPGLFKDKLTYDPLKEFKGVTMMATSPALLVVNPNLPVKTLAELIALAKSRPGKLNYGSGGVGTGPHLAGELLKLATGIDLTHIPYKGTAPALTAVLSDEVDMAFVGISSAAQYIATGQLRAIALSGAKRQPSLPDVPTFAENHLDLDGNSYWGIYAPMGVPDSIIDQLNRAFTQSLHDPENEKKLANLGFAPIANSPQEVDAQWHALVQQWTTVIDKANIKVE